MRLFDILSLLTLGLFPLAQQVNRAFLYTGAEAKESSPSNNNAWLQLRATNEQVTAAIMQKSARQRKASVKNTDVPMESQLEAAKSGQNAKGRETSKVTQATQVTAASGSTEKRWQAEDKAVKISRASTAKRFTANTKRQQKNPRAWSAYRAAIAKKYSDKKMREDPEGQRARQTARTREYRRRKVAGNARLQKGSSTAKSKQRVDSEQKRIGLKAVKLHLTAIDEKSRNVRREAEAKGGEKNNHNQKDQRNFETIRASPAAMQKKWDDRKKQEKPEAYTAFRNTAGRANRAKRIEADLEKKGSSKLVKQSRKDLRKGSNNKQGTGDGDTFMKQHPKQDEPNVTSKPPRRKGGKPLELQMSNRATREPRSRTPGLRGETTASKQMTLKTTSGLGKDFAAPKPKLTKEDHKERWKRIKSNPEAAKKNRERGRKPQAKEARRKRWWKLKSNPEALAKHNEQAKKWSAERRAKRRMIKKAERPKIEAEGSQACRAIDSLAVTSFSDLFGPFGANSCDSD